MPAPSQWLGCSCYPACPSSQKHQLSGHTPCKQSTQTLDSIQLHRHHAMQHFRHSCLHYILRVSLNECNCVFYQHEAAMLNHMDWEAAGLACMFYRLTGTPGSGELGPKQRPGRNGCAGGSGGPAICPSPRPTPRTHSQWSLIAALRHQAPMPGQIHPLRGRPCFMRKYSGVMWGSTSSLVQLNCIAMRSGCTHSVHSSSQMQVESIVL